MSGPITGGVLETPRLVLRRLTRADAGFMLALLNDPAFLRYIGDRGVRTTADAARYIEAGPVASYARFGFGLYAVTPKHGGDPIGICGPVKREELPEPDLGFAYLPAFRAQGYGFEASAAVLVHARDDLKLARLLAITSRDNLASIGLLEKLGFHFDRVARLSEYEPELSVFVREL